mmetsp:Transcript_2105/g.5574  ORF Transcript_2105/g.5574 Transcript_2105/m.5574 type:complete len:298 (+) Transcript_2105:76-969(+)
MPRTFRRWFVVMLLLLLRFGPSRFLFQHGKRKARSLRNRDPSNVFPALDPPAGLPKGKGPVSRLPTRSSVGHRESGVFSVARSRHSRSQTDVFGSRGRWHPSLFRLGRGELDLDVTALYVEGLPLDRLLGPVASVFKGDKPKTPRSIRDLIHHHNGVDHRSELFEYFLESILVDVGWNSSDKDLVVELFRRQFLLLVMMLGITTVFVASVIVRRISGTGLVLVAIPDVNGRRCVAPGLRPFDIDDLVVNFVLALAHDEVDSCRILKDDKGESSRIPRVSIPHHIHRRYGSELLKVKP